MARYSGVSEGWAGHFRGSLLYTAQSVFNQARRREVAMSLSRIHTVDAFRFTGLLLERAHVSQRWLGLRNTWLPC